MSIFRWSSAACFLLSAVFPALAYDPPQASSTLLAGVNFKAATEIDQDYRSQFSACDGSLPQAGKKDFFRGHNLRIPGRSEDRQYYLCSRDPSNVRALLKLDDGGVYWDSKMALDVDGSWAAWNGVPGATDQKETSMKWATVTNKKSRDAQVDPDKYPFVVMPMSGISALTGEDSGRLGREFSTKTGLKIGDMGVVIYRDKWTPVILADGGPFMRLGEGSSRVFEAIGESRCRGWSTDGQTCVGKGNKKYPYRNFGISSGVVFILYPQSADPDLRPENAIAKLCLFAKKRLQLSGGDMCP